MEQDAVSDYLDFSVDWSNPDEIAAYDELPLWSAMAGLLLFEHVPLVPGIRALDVGFGTGFPLFELAQRLGPMATVVGLDPWPPPQARALLKQRVRALTNTALVRGDAATMPFAPNTFDLVVSNLGLNNFDDAPAAVAECARIMRPAATLAITTNLQGHMQEFYTAFDATLAELGFTTEREVLQHHIEHRATVDSVRALFNTAGLQVTRVGERTVPMRFANGSALLRHHLIKVGFLDAWKAAVPDADRARVFERLEANLNATSAVTGELRLTIPLAYIEAMKL